MRASIRCSFPALFSAMLAACAARSAESVRAPVAASAVDRGAALDAQVDAEPEDARVEEEEEEVAARVRAAPDPRATPGAVETIPPPALGAHEGVLLAERAGGTVTCVLDDGSTLALLDGERVTFGDEPIDNAAEGAGRTVAQVQARGVSGYVGNAELLRESRMTRGAGGRYAVFYAVATCDTRCRGRAVVLGPGGARAVVLEEGAPSAVVAFDPAGGAVAVGSRGLAVFSLAQWQRVGAGAEVMAGYTSPAYAPDGRLFVRGAATNGGDDAVFERSIGGAFRRVLAHRGRPPEATGGEAGEREPEPVRFEPGGAVLRVAFARGRVTRTVRANAAGRVLPSE